MNLIIKTTLTQFIGHSIRRSFSRTRNLWDFNEYDKTSLHIMNKDEEFGLMIDAFSQVGFKLNNNITVLGPMIIFNRSVLAWNIADINDVHEDSLSLLKILEPKLDIIVLGTGDALKNHNFFINLLDFSKKHRIAFEILPTESACPTFNFLNAEGRNVVGAMIPPQSISYTDDDELKTKLRYQNVYEVD